MNCRVLTTARMRAADAYTINVLKVPSEELMRRAGTALAEEVIKVAKKFKNPEITTVCGSGNNGGDGFVCAQALLNKGYNVKVYFTGGNLSPDCKREKDRYKGEYSSHICGAIVIDCIFGTGLSREVTGEFKRAVEEINSSGAYVIAADIPSGLDGDNGLLHGCAVKANITVAIGEYKAGMFLNDGLDYCGKIIRRDVGITCPETDCIILNCPDNMLRFFPERQKNSNKGTFGSACLCVGSEKYAGAAVLSLEGALRSGCGYVKLSSCNNLKYALVTKYPSVIYIQEPDLGADAVVIGCGRGVGPELYSEVKFFLANYKKTLVLDADALNSLAKFGVEILKNKSCAVIVTPHVREFSRLIGSDVERVASDPLNLSRDFAKEYGVTVVLKSASTIITDGERTVLSVRGTTALAKGGSGDILAGFLCGTLARGLNSFDASVCAVTALGVAAEIASEQKTDYCATAYDIINNLHYSVKYLTE